MGATGVGKSTLGNQLLGGRAGFKVGHSTNSETTEISWRSDHYLGIGQCITVIDTPGTADTQGMKRSLKTNQIMHFKNSQ